MELIEDGKVPLVIKKIGVEQSLFPVRYHPKHASLQEELHAWAASTLGPAYAEDVDKLQVGPLVSTYYPNTIAKPPRRILTLLKFIYWLFLVDDMVDKSCKDPSTVEVKAIHADQIGSTLLHAIFGFAGEGVQPQYAPFQEALPRVILTGLQMLSEMQNDGMTPTQQARWQSHITRFLQSLGKEQLLITAMGPSLEEYIAFNGLPRGAPILLLATEYSLGIELSKEALASPLVKELQDATCDVLNWENDIFSFEKELVNKDHFMNILYVLQMRSNAGPLHLEAAVSEAWQMIKKRQRDCARLTHEILLSPHLLASSPGLHRYAENLCLLTSGNWYWSAQAARYNVQPNQLPPQASLNAALKPFRVDALKPLLKQYRRFGGRASVGMFVSRCPLPRLAIGK